MYKNIILLILAVFFFIKGNSQFLITQQKSTADYFHTLLPQTSANKFQFLIQRDNTSAAFGREKHQIVSYDFNGLFLDSVNLPKGFVPFGSPLKFNNCYYWSSLYLDSLASYPSTQDAFLLKFDINFNCVAKKRVSNTINNSNERPSNIIEINSKLYTTVRNEATNTLKIYKLDTLFNKLDSVFYTGIYRATELQKTYTNNILIAGMGFSASGPGPGAQKIVMDTSLQIVNIFNLDSLTYVTAGGTVVTGCSAQIGVTPVNSFKILPITSTKNFILGYVPVIYNANCDDRKNIIHSIIDNSNTIINTKLVNNITRPISYADNVNFVDYKNNYIYSVGSTGYDGFLIQPSSSSILVCKSDTMANLIWRKEYGDDMFYRPVSIIMALDSGFLISGTRYNYSHPIYPGIIESYILRLDKNGDIISTGIKKVGNASFESVKVYPNPTKDVIYFDVPFISSYQIDIYDLLGQSVYSDKEYTNLSSIPTEYLSTGVYTFKIRTKQNHFSGKFIKE